MNVFLILLRCRCSKLTSKRDVFSTLLHVLLANSLQKTYLRSRARYERSDDSIVMSSVMQ